MEYKGSAADEAARRAIHKKIGEAIRSQYELAQPLSRRLYELLMELRQQEADRDARRPRNGPLARVDVPTWLPRIQIIGLILLAAEAAGPRDQLPGCVLREDLWLLVSSARHFNRKAEIIRFRELSSKRHVVTNPLNVAVTVRDRDGSVLYRVSPTDRVTIVAKRTVQKPKISKSGPKVAWLTRNRITIGSSKGVARRLRGRI